MEAVQPVQTRLSPRHSRLAIARRVVGILGLSGLVVIAGETAAVLAIVFGPFAMANPKEPPTQLKGRGMAMTGLSLGYSTKADILPAMPVDDVLFTEHVQGTFNTAKQIFVVCLGQVIDKRGNRDEDENGWPKANKFSTSSAFFTNLVGKGAMHVDYSFLAAPGVTPYRGTNGAMFKAKNNAWCVVADIKESDPDRMPVLFTRNLCVTNLAELHGRIRDQLSTDAPYGGRVLILINKDGEAFKLNPDKQWSDYFDGLSFTNRVLRP